MKTLLTQLFFLSLTFCCGFLSHEKITKSNLCKENPSITETESTVAPKSTSLNKGSTSVSQKNFNNNLDNSITPPTITNTEIVTEKDLSRSIELDLIESGLQITFLRQSGVVKTFDKRTRFSKVENTTSLYLIQNKLNEEVLNEAKKINKPITEEVLANIQNSVVKSYLSQIEDSLPSQENQIQAGIQKEHYIQEQQSQLVLDQAEPNPNINRATASE